MGEFKTHSHIFQILQKKQQNLEQRFPYKFLCGPSWIFIACYQAVAVTPVQKVLEMMNEMKAKGEKMMDEEQKTMRAYTEWVE